MKLKDDEFGQTGPMYKNKNCMTCKYRTRTDSRQRHGFCNYISITGKPRIIEVGSSKDCPGFKGRIIKPNRKNVRFSHTREEEDAVYDVRRYY